jgi:CubicO group peptidase (beta-lactamase class C family)
MRRTGGLASAVACALLLSVLAPISLPTPAGASDGYDFSAIDAAMLDATDGCAVVCGAVLGIVRLGAAPGEADVLLEQGWGTYSASTALFTASATKMVSGVTVMAAVDDGYLTLDATVGDYFPEHDGTQKGSITLRQLMSHTAGFGGGASCMSNTSTTLAACADQILDLSLLNAPGERFRYNELGLQVAGRMVEQAVGMPWGQWFDQRVADQLGMTTMSYGPSANPRIGAGLQPSGMQATATDYLKLLEMLIGGGDFRGDEILSAAAFAQLRVDQTLGAPVATSPFPGALGYSVGMWIEAVDGGGLATRLSSPGAFGMYPWVDLTRGYGGWVGVQKDSAAGASIYLDVRPLIQAQIDANPPGTPPPTDPTPPQPVIDALTPPRGPVAGGQQVTITGSGFTGATGVRFSTTVPASAFTVVSDTEITATSPTFAGPGFVNVFVDAPGGTSATSNATLYQILGVPTITAVTPNSGSAAGGSTVQLTGTNLQWLDGVRFGPDTWSYAITNVTSTSATVVVPPRTPGLVNVFARTPGGLSSPGTGTLFAYVNAGPPPTVTGLAPTKGPASGGTVVTITGSGFTGATGIRFGPDTWATTYTVLSDSEISVTSPARTASLVNVFVRNPSGLSATGAQTQYLYQP